jgi:hypothetical protein
MTVFWINERGDVNLTKESFGVDPGPWKQVWLQGSVQLMEGHCVSCERRVDNR